MPRYDATLTFDTDQTPLAISILTEAPATSLSGLYLTAHLPKAANPAKAQLKIAPGTRGDAAIPTQLTVLYTEDTHLVTLDVLATSGASPFPVDVSAARGTNGTPVHAPGNTNAPISLQV